jgi:PAS domain S-box-containing protein
VQTAGRFTYLNAAAVRLFGGRSPDDLLHSSVLERIHPDFHEMARERIRQINEDHTPPPRREIVFLRQDGTPVHAESLGTPITYRRQAGARSSCTNHRAH